MTVAFVILGIPLINTKCWALYLATSLLKGDHSCVGQPQSNSFISL